MQVSAEYGVALVQRIEAKYALSSRVCAAFLAVPRHLFLTPPDGVVTEQWLSEVYQDEAITTKQDTRGMPLSSSSQPSVMALMLDALDVQPGMSVLEIGTGTGYNAALVARLTGDPALVTTVDIDPALTELARSRIEDVVGEGMTIATGDGRLGVAECGLYERIIATASAFPVPRAWIEQLALGGRLVLDLRGRIGGGLMVVVKQADGNATGRFLAVKETISFMGVRETAEGETRREVIEMPLLDEQTMYEPRTAEYACAEHFYSYEQFRAAQREGLNLWMQCRFPALSIKWMQQENREFAVLMDGVSQTTLVIERQEEHMGVAVKGERGGLWAEMVRVYEDWLALGKPGRECLVLVVTPEGQEMRLEQQEEVRTLVIIG